MGTIFEELIRRFNEENNEEAGEHFTPRDVVRLMARLIFLPIAGQITSGTYLVYDGACGTGGMLTVAEDVLAGLAREQHREVAIHLYGQEINPETYAITKSDLLLKGQGEEAENFAHASTLSQDAFPSREFDFMLSNPPYGKSWKTDLERMGGKDDMRDARFVISHGDEPEYSLITRSSDGQLMFLVNMLSKMKRNTPLGSRIAEVHNAKRQKLLQTDLASRDETAAPVIQKVHKPGKAELDPLHGRFEALIDGRSSVVEYEPDPELRDTEQVPLLEEGGIDAFLRREVLPYAPDAWYDPESIKVGYEISFTRYFYKPRALRTLEEIRADILKLQQETEGLLDEIIGGNADAC
jgi:hypothetical protein